MPRVGVPGKTFPTVCSRLLAPWTSWHNLLLLWPKLNRRRPNSAKHPVWPRSMLLRGYWHLPWFLQYHTLWFRITRDIPNAEPGLGDQEHWAHENFLNDAFYNGTSAFFETRKCNRVLLLFRSTRGAYAEVNPNIHWKCSVKLNPTSKTKY